MIAGRRADGAGLLYGLRGSGLAVVVTPPAGPHPEDHYQMTRPFRPTLPGPGLYVAPPGAALPAGLTSSGPAIAVPVGRGVAKSLAMEATPVRW